MKAKLQMQVTGISTCYVFFNQRTASWLDFEPCRYTKFKFVQYARKHFYSYYSRCIDELVKKDNVDAICDWFFYYGYEAGETYTFTEG